MIDTSKAKWELSKQDKYIFNWLDKHGFNATLKQQHISKIVIIVSKNGVVDCAEFESGRKYNIKAIMEQYGKRFELLAQLQNKQ